MQLTPGGGKLDGPAVTIAMPVFNGGDDLRLSVQSIINQSFENWELLLVDDGSTDGAVSALGVLDPRVRVIADGSNRGLAVRLNEIADVARGSFTARMDHDDIAHPERLAQQVAFLSARPDVDVVGSRCVSMSKDGEIVGELPFAETHEQICRRPWLNLYLPHPSWMGRTEWFRRNRYSTPAPYCCEDQELLLRARGTSRYHALPEALLAYRVRAKVPFRKLYRTRVALVTVQMKRFRAEGKLGSLSLSVLTGAARVASDLAREIVPTLRSDIRPLQGVDTSMWDDVIAAARNRREPL